MDDFAQSREPDDLFSDDIEPTEPQVFREQPVTAPLAPSNPPPVSNFQPPQPSRTRGTNTNRGGRRGGHNGLASSAYADPTPKPQTQPAQSVQPAQSAQQPTSTSPKPQTSTKTSPPPTQPAQPAPTVATAPTAPAADPESRTTSVRGDRSATGPAKPTKKTEAELSALMKAMQLKSLAKSEAHARAEKDQASFMQREQQAAAKRTEERKAIREQDMERARNRERKVKAQGAREWDSEKVESDVVDGKNRGSSSMFMRGAHGGIATNTRGGGLANSRYGGEDEEKTGFGGRGGRGGRGRGRGELFQSGRGEESRGRGDFRGGRGGRGRGGQFNNPAKPAPTLTAETDFPALPTTAKAPAASKVEDKALPIMSPVGERNWAEEMATPVEKVEKA